jgi:amino acid adenylation domain-containing protein
MQNSTQGFRLSPQQKSLWFLQQTAGEQPFGAVCEVLIQGEVQPQFLLRAVETVVKRHEILRTTFQRPPGIKTPFQVVTGAADVPVKTADLSDLKVEAQRAKIDERFAFGRARAFDFERGPLLRVSLFKLSRTRHVLLLSLPAICADSMTLTNFAAECGRAYELCLTNQEFTDEPMQYADFAEWQNELLEGADEQAEEGKRYWEELAARSVTTLPLEKRSTAAQSFQPESVSVDIDQTLVSGIKRVAQEHNASVATVLFACWQALIWRLTDQSDFVLFHLSDGRKVEGLRDALGPYAKYLPVACHSEDVSFVAHLRRCDAALREAEDWQVYFDPSRVIETIRDSVAFEFTEQPETIEAGGLGFSLARLEVCLSPFKLKLSCTRTEHSIRAELLFDAQVFDRETVVRVAGYFQRLAAQTSVCDSTERTQGEQQSQTEAYATSAAIGSLDILSEDERRRLVIDLNRTHSEFSNARCIHELFEDQAARTPEAIALVCDERKLTYAELNARANQLAHLLRRRGLAPNARVGLCLGRSAEAIAAMLGILKAGGAYVPLNPEHPPARLALQLAESNASIVIANAGSFNQSLEFAGEVIDLDRDAAVLEAEPNTNPELVTAPEHLAYVIHTSGSTGIPKGVAIRHRGLVNYTEFVLRRLQVKEPLHFATVSTITADLGNTCIFPALVSGGCLHIISYDVAMEGDSFAAYAAKRPIDVLKIVPSHLGALLASRPKGDISPRRYLILGGEALSRELLERIAQTKPTCEIINHYGPTETTVGSLTFSVNANEFSPYSLTVPIGRPIANTQVYILDRRLNPAPTGVAGELYIGGAGVAAAYLNQAAETAARFVPDPFSDERDARLYRTGDLARYLPDGNVEFLGRVDHQVKVRGFRVELGEIEGVLSQHPGVQQAVVTVRLDAGGADIPSSVVGSAHAGSADILAASSAVTQRLVAYLVPFGVKPPTNDELRTFLQQHLPDYMIPSAFVFLKTLPLTPNGKVDRAALPAPDALRPEMQRNFVAPRNVVETELAGIWGSMLKLEAVGVHDNFFDLGGHSLLATQVISRMRTAFQLEIPLRALFESPTVAELAGRIEHYAQLERADLLAELEALSEDEAERLLELERAGSGDRKSS